MELALDSGVSTRHISFLETGRSQPSRQMILHLAEHLDIPLRERNELMIAAGYAPVYPATPLDDVSMDVVRSAIELVLTGHEPYPALAIDRYWTLVAANRALGPLLAGVSPALLEPPVNVLRLSLHPDGLAPRIVNFDQWRDHVLRRLRGYIGTSADPVLVELHDELRSYPAGDVRTHSVEGGPDQKVDDLVIPLRMQTDVGVLSFISTTTVFGTANDVNLAELAIESFFPADKATAGILRETAIP